MKCYVYSKRDFENLMRNYGWNKTTDVPDSVAIISICCTEDCIRGYLAARDPDADDSHWFDHSTSNIINIDFDDIIDDEFESNGYIYKCITNEQAKELHDFIWNNKGKDFYIHCRAGKSRSQAVGRYIRETFEGYEERKDNPCLYGNINVLNKLRRIDYNYENTDR